MTRPPLSSSSLLILIKNIDFQTTPIDQLKKTAISIHTTALQIFMTQKLSRVEKSKMNLSSRRKILPRVKVEFIITYKKNKCFNADLLNLSAMRLEAARASLLASPT